MLHAEKQVGELGYIIEAVHAPACQVYRAFVATARATPTISQKGYAAQRGN